jgi:hypothetical protein
MVFNYLGEESHIEVHCLYYFIRGFHLYLLEVIQGITWEERIGDVLAKRALECLEVETNELLQLCFPFIFL